MSIFKNQVNCALVTGSSSGLGLGLTCMLVQEGVEVVGLSRNPEIPDISPNYHPWRFDLQEIDQLPNTIEAILSKHPQIDLVINNAGYGVLNRLENLDADTINQQYAVMLQAPTILAARAIEHFKKIGHGCLVNMSSMAVEVPIPLMPIYNASKAGLSSLSESLMLDASDGEVPYSVIDVQPGDFNTEFGVRMVGQTQWNGVDLRKVMDKHHASAPDISSAIRDIQKAILAGKSQRIRVGTFFQTCIGTLGARTLPGNLRRWIIRDYYSQ